MLSDGQWLLFADATYKITLAVGPHLHRDIAATQDTDPALLSGQLLPWSGLGLLEALWAQEDAGPSFPFSLVLLWDFRRTVRADGGNEDINAKHGISQGDFIAILKVVFLELETSAFLSGHALRA